MKNPIGLHMCYWQGSAIAGDMDRMADLTAETGVDIMELSAGDLRAMSPAQRRDLRARLRGLGLKTTINGGLVTQQNDISSPDPAIRRRGFDHCVAMLELCAEMESTSWSGLLHSAWLLRPDPADPQRDRRLTWSRAVEGMQTLAREAERHGVVCCLEVVNRYEQFVFNTAEDGVAFCTEVGNANCKLLLDTFHMAIEEDYMPASVIAAQEAACIGYIHIGESNRRLPTGMHSNIDWHAFAEAVKTSGYEGPLVLEPFELATTPGASKVCIWRGFADPDDVQAMVARARTSVQYLRSL
ncbi:MAG: sugar phosphate isomerase/epimerase [Planctomycetaceae bacterium]|nr:sugar phosphate isomerase/epimerase [Planctomycetaceae bacterium]